MREFHVVVLVDEAHDVVENENALHAVAHHLVLRFQPVDDHARTKVDEPVGPLRVLHQVDHEVRRAPHETGGAEGTARSDHGEDVAVVQDSLPVHADAVQRHGGEGVRLHLVLGELVDILQPVERVVLARSVILPEFDLRAQHRGFRRHPVLHPPGRNEDDVGELAHDLEVRFEPKLGVQEVIHVLDPQIAWNPRAIDDQRHRDLVHFFPARGLLKRFPLVRQHGVY